MFIVDKNKLDELVLEALKGWDEKLGERGIGINTGEFRQSGMIDVQEPHRNDEQIKSLYQQPHSHIRFLQTRYGGGEWIDGGLKIIALKPTSSKTPQKLVTDDGMNWERSKPLLDSENVENDRLRTPIILPLVGPEDSQAVGNLDIILGSQCRAFKNLDSPFTFVDMEGELGSEYRTEFGSLKVRNPLEVPQTFAYLRVPTGTHYRDM